MLFKDCIVINIKSRYFSKWIQRRKFIENVSIELILLLLQMLQIKFEYFIIHFRFAGSPWCSCHDTLDHFKISHKTTNTGISSEFSENVKNPVSQQPDAMTPIRKSYFYHRVQDVNYHKTESPSLLTSPPLF